jgi:hypothetical protein
MGPICECSTHTTRFKSVVFGNGYGRGDESVTWCIGIARAGHAKTGVRIDRKFALFLDTIICKLVALFLELSVACLRAQWIGAAPFQYLCRVLFSEHGHCTQRHLCYT